MDKVIANARLYLPDRVILGNLVLSQDSMKIISNLENYSLRKKTINLNAGNNIIAPSLIDISADLNKMAESKTYEELKWLVQNNRRYGSTIICPILTPSSISKKFALLLSNTRIKQLWGYRVSCKTINEIDEAVKILSEGQSKIRIVDFILPIKFLSYAKKMSKFKNNEIRVCVEIDNTTDIIGQDLDLLSSDDCISIPTNLLPEFVDDKRCWIEWRLPEPGSLIFNKIGATDFKKIIIRSHRKDLTTTLNVTMTPKDQLYFRNDHNCIYMPPNYAVRYINRGFEVPLHKALSIVTLNHGKYIRLDNDQAIQTGMRCDLVMMDGKLDVMQSF